MVILTDATRERVDALFAASSVEEVVRFLENGCADNLPFSEGSSSEDLERVRFAALKVSRGDLERLVDAITLAQTDWRDLLVAAGFADDIHAHREWSP